MLHVVGMVPGMRSKPHSETLDSLLLSLGLGLTEAAAKAGISKVTLYSWRRGLRVPRNPQMFALAKALGVPVERVAAAVKASAAAADK